MSIIGSGKESSPALIRMFLEADTARELVGLQLKVNILLKGRADYTDFSNVDGKWYCWFAVDIDKNPEVLKVNDANTK
jgi:hypothetical protein